MTTSLARFRERSITFAQRLLTAMKLPHMPIGRRGGPLSAAANPDALLTTRASKERRIEAKVRRSTTKRGGESSRSLSDRVSR